MGNSTNACATWPASLSEMRATSRYSSCRLVGVSNSSSSGALVNTCRAPREARTGAPPTPQPVRVTRERSRLATQRRIRGEYTDAALARKAKLGGMLEAGNLTVILHQTRSPENLGAVARVMANFGFSRLILSDPATYAFRGAERLAVKGDAVLDAMAVARNLPEALTDCVYAVGTTSRTQIEERVALTPEQAVARLADQSRRGRV